jgi:serine/threonine protein kinase
VTQETRPGTVLAGYRIESVIGRGGMGVVYLAEHLRLKRKVALKVLAPELATDERFRERFLAEAEQAASLDHANVVTVHDAGEAEGLLYIAMRFVQGTDLKGLIEREGALEPVRAADLVGQVARALDSAHAKGLIHRDVKPANVLVTHDEDGAERALLADFGLTKRPDQTTGLTRTGQFMGSVDYAAPEQFEGRPLDARTDVYSLACVAFECLTGRVPFPREQEAAVMYAHLQSNPPKVSATRPALPAETDRVIAIGMAKRPADRYRSAGALASALGASIATPKAEGSPRRPSWSRTRRLGLLGVAAVVLAGGVLYGVTRGGKPHAPGRSPAPPGSGSRGVPASIATGGVLSIDPTGTTVLRSIDTSGLLAEGSGFLWVGSKSGVDKVDPSSGKVIAHIPVPNVDDIAFGDGYLWTTGGASGQGANGAIVGESLFRIDPQTNRSKRLALFPPRVSSPSGLSPGQLAAGEGFVWITFAAPTASVQLLKIDERTGEIVDSISTPTEAAGVTVGEGAVWVRSNLASPYVYKVDPATGNIIGSLSLGGADDVVARDGDVWVADATDDAVIRVDPATVTQISVLSGPFVQPGSVDVAMGILWVLNRGDCSLVRVQLANNAKGAPLSLPHGGAVLASRDGVWVAAAGAFGGPECTSG